MTNPRALALDVLVRVEWCLSRRAVGETLARCSLEPRDAALFTRLAYGTVAWQARIDWTLQRSSTATGGARSADPGILRLAYQLTDSSDPRPRRRRRHGGGCRDGRAAAGWVW
jgi:hypothetical protein